MRTIRQALKHYISTGTSKNDAIDLVSNECGCKTESVSRVYRSLFPSKKSPKSVEPKSGRTLEDFKKAYDKNTYIPEKITSALKELGDSWEYESDFVRRSGVNYSDLGNFREMFSANVVYVKSNGGKRIWCGTDSFAQKLRELI
jgi:hypothetical protein